VRTRLLLTVAALLLLTCGASAAGPAAAPARVALAGGGSPTLGRPWTAVLTVRPASFAGELRVTAAGPRPFTVRATRGARSYRARLVFPAVGRWTLTARAAGRTFRLGAVTVRRPAPLRFAWPTSVDAQPDGTLLVVENGRGRVLVVNPVTGGVRELATLAKPFAAVRAPSGSVYVSDGPTLRRLGAGAPATVATADADVGPLAVASNGDVFYAAGARLFRVRAGGEPQAVASGLSNAHGLAIAAGGAVLVSDTGNDRVLRVDPDGGAPSTLIRVGQPRGIDVAADGTILLVEAAAKRVGRYGAAGDRIGSVGPAYADPYDVVAGAGGAVFVVDTSASGVIRRVAVDGTTLTIPTG
jgi:sugar lactone lactonase YvrE